MGLEEVREMLYLYIDKYGIADKRTVEMSEILDKYVFDDIKKESSDLCEAVC